ncbi:unnamed protein product, partial [Musa textilis]
MYRPNKTVDPSTKSQGQFSAIRSVRPIAQRLRRCPLDRSLRRNHSRRSSCCVKPGDFKVHEHMKISCP